MDGTCKTAAPQEPQRAIPHELECLVDRVTGLENTAGRLAERLQNGSVPPSPEGKPVELAERSANPCPIAETITQLSERVEFVRNRIDDLCERVQL